MNDKTDIEELDNILIELVKAIDLERNGLKEEYKKSSQYKSSGKYKIFDEKHLDILLVKRNALVDVINYIRTGKEESLEDIDFRKKV
ncbi:MAG: hypothetical protein HFJ52_04150 [Clostridia bacterium]|jgi:hypothetical protein|nr:hypothetical protein [Clostridia bacterium]